MMARQARPARGWSGRARQLLLIALIGAAVALIVGGLVGVAIGAVAGTALGTAAHRWLLRQPSPATVAENRRVAVDMPFAADLLAAALRAGAAPDAAARCVGRAIGGPLGDRLILVDRALSLGASAEEAWSYLGDVAGASRVSQAAVRSQHSGAAFAGAL
ncbi:MAG TPA: secretion system protein, partial [Micromonosporaceae bacterium]